MTRYPGDRQNQKRAAYKITETDMNCGPMQQDAVDSVSNAAYIV